MGLLQWDRFGHSETGRQVEFSLRESRGGMGPIRVPVHIDSEQRQPDAVATAGLCFSTLG